MEPVFQVVRHGEAVVGHFCIITQSARYEVPVEEGPQTETKGRPECGNTDGISKTGQAHEHPAAHIRGFGTHGSNPRAETASAQDIVTEALLGPGVVDTDGQHGQEIEGKGAQNDNICLKHE